MTATLTSQRTSAPAPINPAKEAAELKWWADLHAKQGRLTASRYERYYTQLFALSRGDYTNKRVLDLGCGPCGTLEWADTAARRVGLDPLADQYRSLGTASHKMEYAAAPAERMPFADGSFDIIASFNSLDHVDDLEAVIGEIIRVLAPGGLFLLLSDIHDKPTVCEPTAYGWDIVERFTPALRLLHERHYEFDTGMYRSLDRAVLFDHGDPRKRYGVLAAKFVK